MSDDIDKIVDDLVGQFKGVNQVKKKKDDLQISDETLKDFLYKYSGKLIKDSVEVVDDIKDFITAAPDSRDLEALSKLIGASAAAIETLNKIQIADEKNKTQVGIKAMDIEAKKELNLQKAEDHVLTMNREELIDKLISKAKVISDEPTKQQSDQQ